MAQDVDQTLVLYKSSRALGCRRMLRPRASNREAMWTLMAATGEGVYYFAVKTEAG